VSFAATTPRRFRADGKPLVRVRGLTKRFPVESDVFGRTTSWLSAVDDVDLDIQLGETLALVGESGSGKSTLARLLLRLVPATSGSVLFDDVDVLTASPKDLRAFRQRAQIVFQDPYGSLDPRMRVWAIVAEGMGHMGLSRAERKQRVADLFELVQLPRHVMNRFPHEFSGGQRQRISIARALAVKPTFLIADEPVSALDVSVQSHILNLLFDLREQLQLTYLFVSHDMSVVHHIADRVAVMYLGKIVEVAPASELFTNPRHPYTQALLSSVPELTRHGIDRRLVLKGDIPSPIDPPKACRFAGRCFRAIDVCRSQEPLLEPVAGSHDHTIACFNSVPFAEVRANGHHAR
jgi:oligopeptide/dipeptide ABC transporter ATP-binding protein